MENPAQSKTTPKRAYCFGCGEDIGPKLGSSFYDTCGRIECDRESRDALYAERDEAHEQLDRDLGFGW